MGIKSLFGFGQAGISLWIRQQMQDIRFCLEGQQAGSLLMKELQCRPRQYMPVSESLRKQWLLYRFMYMSIRMTVARSWCMTCLLYTSEVEGLLEENSLLPPWSIDRHVRS